MGEVVDRAAAWADGGLDAVWSEVNDALINGQLTFDLVAASIRASYAAGYQAALSQPEGHEDETAMCNAEALWLALPVL